MTVRVFIKPLFQFEQRSRDAYRTFRFQSEALAMLTMC